MRGTQACRDGLKGRDQTAESLDLVPSLPAVCLWARHLRSMNLSEGGKYREPQGGVGAVWGLMKSEDSTEPFPRSQGSGRGIKSFFVAVFAIFQN